MEAFINQDVSYVDWLVYQELNSRPIEELGKGAYEYKECRY